MTALDIQRLVFKDDLTGRMAHCNRCLTQATHHDAFEDCLTAVRETLGAHEPTCLLRRWNASPSAEGVRLAGRMIPCSKADYNRDQVPGDRGSWRYVGPTFDPAEPETKRQRAPLSVAQKHESPVKPRARPH